MADGAHLDAVRSAERLIRTAAWLLDRMDDLERRDPATLRGARALIARLDDERLSSMFDSSALDWFDLANELIERGGALLSLERMFPGTPAPREARDVETERGREGETLVGT